MSERLEVDGREVYLQGNSVVLRTPGLQGDVEVLGVGGATSRSEMSDRLDELTSAAGFEPDLVVAISNAQEIDLPPGVTTRSSHDGEPGIELEVPAPSDGWGQVLLHSDEAGLTTWHYPERHGPESVAGGGVVTRGGRANLFVVPRAVAESDPSEAGTTRGIVGQLGMRILKVLSFKLVSAVGGTLGAMAVGEFERRKRPYGVRPFGPADFRQGPAASAHGDAGFWQGLRGGRALLFVHGTFSRSDWAFGQLDPGVMQELNQRYGQRLFSFDHPTLASDPRDNADWLFEHMPSPAAFDLDIVCHSRGGLLARRLALDLASRGGKVGRIVFVAVPNVGTPLADVAHLRTLVDVYTNMLSFLPDTGVLEAFEAVFEVVKELAAGTGNRLTGAQSMCPGGSFLEALNGGPSLAGTRCFALASDYQPQRPAGWKKWIKNRLVDGIFQQQNDLVVPTRGGFEGSGAGFPRFDTGDWKVLDPADEVGHTHFFGQPAVHQALLDWLR